MIIHIAETGSTNADIIASLRQGNIWPEGCWLVADRQFAGRGRLGRAWCDGSGNFMGSSLVPWHLGDPPPATLALVAGLAVLEAITPRLVAPARAELKWPNDIMISGAKLAGILLERLENHIVIGVGVNLASAPDLPDRTTVALARFGPVPDRDGFANDLARTFVSEVRRWRHEGLASLIERWQALAHPRGTALSITEADGSRLRGNFSGLNCDGALRVRLQNGTERTIHAGDVDLA